MENMRTEMNYKFKNPRSIGIFFASSKHLSSSILQQQGSKSKLFGSSSSSISSRSITSNLIVKVVRRIKKLMLIVCTVSLLFLGTVASHTRTSHASSTTTSTSSSTSTHLVASKTIMKNNRDEIIQKYVEKHMFDDEVFDPFESAYREGYKDQVYGTNTVTDILGRKGSDDENTKDEKGLSKTLKGIDEALILWMQTKLGLDLKAAKVVKSISSIVLIPLSFLAVFMTASGAFRGIYINTEKRTYGKNRALEGDDDDEDEEDDDEGEDIDDDKKGDDEEDDEDDEDDE